jgi:hypothetical protein
MPCPTLQHERFQPIDKKRDRPSLLSYLPVLFVRGELTSVPLLYDRAYKMVVGTEEGTPFQHFLDAEVLVRIRLIIEECY